LKSKVKQVVLFC